MVQDELLKHSHQLFNVNKGMCLMLLLGGDTHGHLTVYKEVHVLTCKHRLESRQANLIYTHTGRASHGS